MKVRAAPEKILLKLKPLLKTKWLFKVFVYVLLINMAFVFLYPFIYMLITSLKSPRDVLDVTVNWLLNEVHLNNYRLSFEVLNYPPALIRTSLFVIICTSGHLLSCSFIGYGFARFEFKGKNFFFLFLLLSIIVPAQTLIVPVYMLFAQIGFLGTNLPMALPTWFGFGLGGGLFIFIFRQFYLSLPRSLEEAASIDGCGIFKTFFKIVLPSSRSSVLVCLVLSLVWHWNDYFEPTIYITSAEKYLLPMRLPGIYSIMSGGQGTEQALDSMAEIYTEAVAMAATTLVILPLFIAYIFLQKKFVQGVERSGITGE